MRVIHLAISAYFLVVVCAGTLLTFPRARAGVAGTLRHATAALRGGLRHIARNGRSGLDASRRRTARAGGVTRAFIRSHRWMAIAGVSLVVGPPILALIVHAPSVREFADERRVPDRRVAQLLQGEQLVPPPRLPPEVFTTREVVLVRPAAAWASRDWALLDPPFRQRLLLVFRLMRERHGYELALLEGYRSAERQETLAAQGPHVTRAGADMSYHQSGLAADVAFYREGKLLISERDPWAMQGYRLYGELAEELGLTWGGRWQMKDFGHVELRRAAARPGARS